MGRPENGVYIIQGEVNLVVTAMKRNSRWSTHSNQDDEQDPLLVSFSQLKDVLNNITDIQELTPNEYLSSFLEVIRSEDTTGPITGLALTSVNKFLSYGLVDGNSNTSAAAIENIADAVTHARFVGTDPSSDEVVLMKILHVLRTLLLTPPGMMLTNESVCEIMQSCFRICFEMRLSELLRKSAENTLMDMVQLLFSRLPLFKEDPKWATSLKKLKMRAGGMEPPRGVRFRKRSPKPSKNVKPILPHVQSSQSSHLESTDNSGSTEHFSVNQEFDMSCKDGIALNRSSSVKSHEGTFTREYVVFPSTDAASIIKAPDSLTSIPDEDRSASIATTIATTPVSVTRTVVDIHKGFEDTYEGDCAIDMGKISVDIKEHDSDMVSSTVSLHSVGAMAKDVSMKEQRYDVEKMAEAREWTGDKYSMSSTTVGEYINPRGVRFMPPGHHHSRDGPLIPYGLPCVRELFRFLVSLTNPVDRHNTDVMVHMGLCLLTVAHETGADHIAGFSSLVCLVKDNLSKNLFFLLQSDRISLFAASLRVCFLLFESMRGHLKFQLEMYLTRLMDIITSETSRISLEQREIALESLVQLLRIPGLVTELYLNYDCDLYCSNLFEDLMKLLSKNAFPVSGLYTTHILSLDALLAVIDSIEQHCHHRVLHSSEKHGDSRTACDDSDQSNTSVTEDKVEVCSEEKVTHEGGSTLSKLVSQKETDKDIDKTEIKEKRTVPRIRPNRMKLSMNIPTEEELAAIRHKKKIYHTGSEQFNMNPSKGIKFLQEHNLLNDPLEPGLVVQFLKENPKLDKKQIGEYISNRKNSQVLEAFQKSFIFDDVRIDEALRMYLETFRLPGEAPVISYLLEHFADHWHKMNGEPFANTDAAFTLAYAILMLNTDQHNTNAKKQNLPMNGDDFKRNLRRVNGGQDFDEDMLEEIFTAIREDEIVMPAEQVGLVRENYLWKMLIRRGNSKDGCFTHAPTGSFDRDLFMLVWGPTVAALSFVFDKSVEDTIIQKATSGFRKCAMISAHYNMSDVFDNLVISLCKFTTLLSTVEHAELIPISFGSNSKAQLAAKTVFGLAHRHGDILREGWKNILDCMVQLYRAKLLPESLVQVEDFISPIGKVCIMREEVTSTQRVDSGVLSSFYSYFTLTEPTPQRGPNADEVEASKRAQRCIIECHVEQLVQESKFLQIDSLQEFLKALMFASQCQDPHDGLGISRCDEESPVFVLELLMKVVLENRDRISPFWQNIRDHLYTLIVNAAEPSFLVQRAVVGLLRLAIRLLRREEIASQVLTSLRMLLMMKPVIIHAIARHIAYGVHDLITTNAANIHSMNDWFTLFTLLEVVGAGSHPPLIPAEKEVNSHLDTISESGAQSDSEVTSSTQADTESGDRGYTSDSELYGAHNRLGTKSSSTTTNINGEMEIKPLPDSHGSWILVYNKNQGDRKKSFEYMEHSLQKALRRNQYCIDLNEEQSFHDYKALTKSCETLAFLVRDAAHVTPHNFESCVHSIRTFVEASLNGGRPFKQSNKNATPPPEKKKAFRKHRKSENHMSRSRSSPSHLSRQDSDDEKEVDGYHSLSIQLLDLMHTLHTRASTVFNSWAEEAQNQLSEPCGSSEGIPGIDAGTSTLWTKCWCPLLQGIACLCCDSRRAVRSQALTYLQRALLVHDLQTLSAHEWESCFNKVLFPLLSKLLQPINSQDPNGMEETRMRASTLLCKVFLQHLSPLLSLSTFTALWLTILDFMDKYMHADKSDLLGEAIPESLKNMLLVMHTAGILDRVETEESQLWKLTWDRIDTFLPKLRDDVFKPRETSDSKVPVLDEGNDEPCFSTTSTPICHIPSQSVAEQCPETMNSKQPAQYPQASIEGRTLFANEPGRAHEDDSMQFPIKSDCDTTQAAENSNSQSAMVLHPPLPLLLNPDLVHSANIPILSPQDSLEKKAFDPEDL